ncbi:MAG TPA: hypothetical protein VNA25_27205 [Phycisphaerae bacterium]|nr:hypothetical protein [Phycisphaerae bacterium]
MEIAGLGKLTPDEDIEEWLASRPVSVPFFEGLPLRFVFNGMAEDDGQHEYVEAYTNFMTLTREDRKHASACVYRNYQEFVAAVGPEDVSCHIASAEDVWKHVRPTEIFVARRHRRDRKVYVQITAECDWEREHGLQIVYREGKTLSRVSDQDGHLTHTDAYDLPEDEDRIC